MDAKLFVSVLMMLLIQHSVSVTNNGITLTPTIISNISLILSCHVKESSCCKNFNEVEYKVNTQGVCTLKQCNGLVDMPRRIHDTRFYLCGCSDDQKKATILHITNLRESDYGTWTCSCNSKEGNGICRSNEVNIDNEVLGRRINDVPPFMSSSFDMFLFPVFVLCGILVCVMSITVFVCLVRRNVNKSKTPDKLNRASRLCFNFLGYGKFVNGTSDEEQHKLVTVSHQQLNKLVTVWHQPIEKYKQTAIEDVKVYITSTDKDCNTEVLLLLAERAPMLVHDALIEKRVQPSWCYCGYCIEMESPEWRVCCQKKDTGENCLTYTTQFKENCLNEKLLEKMVDHKKTKDVSEKMCALRYAAYKQCDIIINGRQGAEQRLTVIGPSCCVNKIRITFPHPSHMFHTNDCKMDRLKIINYMDEELIL